jgi:hypothetical protein
MLESELKVEAPSKAFELRAVFNYSTVITTVIRMNQIFSEM